MFPVTVCLFFKPPSQGWNTADGTDASTDEGANRRSRNHIEICHAATLS
jgi:hypothetical protein